MGPRDLLLLILLAAIWGASFLFMRVAAPAFGPVPLVSARLLIATICLLTVLAVQGEVRELRSNWGKLIFVGIFNSAIPFALLAYSTLSLTAGFTSLLNAATPLMTALLGALFWKQRLLLTQWLGLCIGLTGIAILSWGNLSFKPGGSGWAIAASIAATVCYGLAGNYSKRHLWNVSALASATGSIAAATVIMVVPGIQACPPQWPNTMDWVSVVGLGVLCTALAYIIYFHLIYKSGPTQTASVTFLVPIFAIGWGALFLGESVTPRMLVALVVIIAGTGLSTGIISRDRLRSVWP